MKVKFVPQNVEFDIKPGESVMHVAQDHGIYIKSVCKGVPSCAECRVRVVEGEHNVLPPGSEELALIGTGHFIDRRRLSCQLKCFGDITVDMMEQIDKQATGGKKSRKQVVKDDRVEESVAIRGDSFDEDAETSGETEPSRESDQRPAQKQQQQQQQRAQQNQREGGGKPRSQQNQRSEQKLDQRSDQRQAGQQSQQKNQSPPQRAGGAPAAQGGDKEGGAKKRRRRRRGRGGGGGNGGSPSTGGQGGAGQNASPGAPKS